MYSTFHGLETARRALVAQQTALHTTGHNIANANREGYTRQRVNFTNTEPFPNVARNAPRVPGQIGTGVKADFIQRMRDRYLDIQYRGENAQSSYWDARYGVLERIEDLLNEPSETNLSSTMDQFWQSLQDLAVHPEDAGARSVVRQRGMALAETFNYISDSLQAQKRDLQAEIEVTVNQINSLLHQINDINKQVARIEPHGYMPNDLYDERDRLIDQLSSLMNIEVEYEESGGQALDAAVGKANIYLLDEEGNRITVNGDLLDEEGNRITVDGEELKIIDANTLEYKEMKINFYNDEENHDAYHDYVAGITFGGENFEVSKLLSSPGKMKALIEAYGYDDDGTTVGTYPELLKDLDEMVYEFVKAFNKQHYQGSGLAKEGEDNPPTNRLFFDWSGTVNPDNKQRAAENITIHPHIDDLDNIAAAPKDGDAGDGSNALALANIKDKLIFDGTASVQSFYQGIIGELAVDTSEAQQQMFNTDALRDNVDFRRKQVTSVSLDEEFTNLIQYQHAYNAAARNITAVDEMLDRIINNMGIVGR
ncbi:flagellar hook-associated protein FlgK [Aliibacillus thermotolerans]|uniref:Flagellar hook-associated protein 1 n=1 Tax=Aliibacillus thermotolerans TaxID=1834418 RepID=A0ABW0U6T9_9BACI|nr:flagellar hook-associated protein FlgK [Aliibacillus thermotolerans]MDA3130948.1 flagellar hook-associated protein FlgK [Aliibacillus thermotolerans]